MEVRNTSFFRKITALKRLSKAMAIKPTYFIIQVSISLLAALFDGLSLALLAPLAKGIIDQNFSFLASLPVFKTIVAYFPNMFIAAPNKLLFFLLIGAIFIAVMLKTAAAYIGCLHSVYWKGRYTVNMKKLIFERYLSFGKMFFDKASQGYVGKILAFVDMAVGLLVELNVVLVSFCTIIVYVIIMSMATWKLTLLILMLFPIYHFSLDWLVKKIKETGFLQTKVTLKLGREVFNILSCINLVKAYSREEEAKRRFNDITDHLRRIDFSMEKKTRLIPALQEMITIILILFLMSAVAFIFIKSKAGQAAGYILFFILVRKCVPLFGKFSIAKAKVAREEGRIREIISIFDDRDKFFVPDGQRIFKRLEREIELRHTKFSYVKGIEVLRDISFSIKKGEITAVIGPTGAGKTTIISLILRFYDCHPSTIFFDGIDIREFNIKSLRSKMAVVSQNIDIFNDTLKANIVYGVEGKLFKEQLTQVIKRAKLCEFVKKLPKGLDTEVGDRGVKLSGGEKQRVSIARALLRDSEILILDEATSALDTHTERFVQEAIEEAVRGRTTIVIAHRLSTVKNADKIVVIEEGRLIEEGTLKDLLEKKGKFYQYWEEQKFY